MALCFRYAARGRIAALCDVDDAKVARGESSDERWQLLRSS